MKKTNKKLASAIVLGLMLAVPVGASAAVSGPSENGVITVTGSHGTSIGSDESRNDIVFEAESSWNGSDGAIYANNITAEKRAGNGSDFNNLFYVGSGKELTINAAGNIVVEKGSTGIEAFHTMSGNLDVDAENIYVYDSVTAVCAQTGSGAGDGVIDIDATNDIYLKTTGYKAVTSATYNGNTGATSVDIAAGNNLTIVTEGGSHAVAVTTTYKDGSHNTNGNSMNLSAGNTLKIQGIDTNDKTSEAILVENSGSTDARQKLNISAKDIIIDGNIDVLNKGDVTIGGNVGFNSAVINGDITATKNSNLDLNLGTGVYEGTIDVNGSTVTINDGSNIILGGDIINPQGGLSSVKAAGGGEVVIDGADKITMTGVESTEELGGNTGYNIFHAHTGSSIEITNVGSIEGLYDADYIGENADGIRVNAFKAWGGDITVGEDGNTIGKIDIRNVEVGFAAEAFENNDANLTVHADNIYMSTVGGEAVHARIDDTNNKTSTAELNATGDITLISKTTESTWANKDRATVSVYQNNVNTVANSDSSVFLNAGGTLTIINETEDGDAIYVENGTGGKVTSVTAQGANVVIVGNITATDDTSVVIGKEDGSSVINFTGKITDDNVSGAESQSLYFAKSATDNGVVFNMAKDSVLNLTGDSTVTELSGEGAVKIADKDVTEVKIGKVTDGSNIIYGNTAAVTDTFKSAADAETYAAKFKVDNAGLKDATYKSDAGSVLGDIYISYDETGTATVTQKVNENNQAISNMASIGLMAWRAENNDMNKRLGELRNSNGEHGVWARMVRGESEFGAQNVKNVYNTYQLGYDEKLSTNDNWTVGAAISYTDGQSSFANGSGENTSKGLSFYGSYLGDNGEFVDLIAKYARLDNEFDVAGGAGSGDYSTNGYSFSAEFGKRNQLANDFYFEPQVELTYGRVADVDYVTSEKVKVSQDSMDSLVGRVGFAAGKNIKNGNVYVRASYLYDFDGETNVTFVNDAGAETSFSEDLGGGWFEFGIGTNINLSDATYLYLDVEKTTGGEVDTNWQWNAGVRYSF